MRERGVAIVLGLTLLGLVGGFFLKDQCVGVVLKSPGYDGSQYTRSCYSDIYVLYFFRGLDREPVPYVHGDGVFQERGEAGDLEYPLGTGLFVAAAALIAHDAVAFFVWSALILGAAGMVSAMFLLRLAADRRRVLYFALAPSLLLYAFHNWDLAAVALMCGAMYAWWKRRDGTAGALAALGAATKIFPGVLVPAFWLAASREDRFRGKRVVGAAMIAFGAINLPFAIANFHGWWGPWQFQSSRFPNYDSTWFMIHRHVFTDSFDIYARNVSMLSVALFLFGAFALMWVESRRDVIRPYVLAYQLLLLFLLTGKVFSPQYALWVLPFFVLIDIEWWVFAVFAVTEAAVWFTIASYLLAISYGVGDPSLRLNLTEIAVWARFAALAWMLLRSRGARELVTPHVTEPLAIPSGSDASGS